MIDHLVLTGAVLAAWVTAVTVAALSGPVPWLEVSLAALVCLVPGWLVLAIDRVGWVDELKIQIAMANTLLRLMVVMAAVVLFLYVNPIVSPRPFLFSLLWFYLAALVVETGLMLRRMRAPAPAGQGRR